ncbi:hypothetical protein ACJRO7_020504 [Eucalyptus globulus]|uniref:Peptidase A1 domain-containing protein n=1 Tax=Eucalyptus globulus TaxID=34317 RepID=A0ABD3KIC3_EUCGL
MEASLKFHSLLSFTLILAFSILCESASDYGFTTELIHRDSPRSPYYNPADTPYQRLANAIRRSISRAHLLSLNSGGATLDTPSAVITAAGGEYIMKVSLGTPPVDFLGIADTGSDLIWTQCKPCTDCFEQASPLFDPSKSSTYKEVSCQTSQCEVVRQTSCGGGGSLCEYSYAYGDQSYTQGNLATETFTLGSTSGQPVSFPKLVFGCGHSNGGSFDNRVDGLFGLGGGDASLVTQLGTATGGKFSYCLVPLSSNETSKLNFGANAGVTGDGAVSTPLIQKDPKTFYYLSLEAVSVGETKIDFPSDGSSSSADEGNIIIDSGTTLTLLPQDLYSQIEDAVAKAVDLPKASDPTQLLSLCFRVESDAQLSLPTVTFHFKGADVELSPKNTFLQVADGVICLSFRPEKVSIFGNLAQINYLIGYDIQNSKLYFKPVDCASN